MLSSVLSVLLMSGSTSLSPAVAETVPGPALVATVDAPVAAKPAPVRVAGPFATYAKAADYADYLEDEYGYRTRVVRSGNGFYYVYFW
jgi:hypothetical protein